MRVFRSKKYPIILTLTCLLTGCAEKFFIKNDCDKKVTFIFEDNRTRMTQIQRNIQSRAPKEANFFWLNSPYEEAARHALRKASRDSSCSIVYLGYNYGKIVPEFALHNPEKTFVVIDQKLPPRKNLIQIQFDDFVIGQELIDRIQLKNLKNPVISLIWGGRTNNTEALTMGLQFQAKKITPSAKINIHYNENSPIWGNPEAAKKQVMETVSKNGGVLVAGAADADLVIADQALQQGLSPIFIDGPSDKYCLKFEKLIEEETFKLLDRLYSGNPIVNIIQGKWKILEDQTGKRCFSK